MEKKLIAIPTCWKFNYPQNDIGGAHNNDGHGLRSKAVRDTWYKEWEKYKEQIDLKFFYGYKPEGAPEVDEENIVILDCPDDYYSLPLKVQKIFEWAVGRGYDYVFKVDDDVMVFVDRLLAAFKPCTYLGFSNGWFVSGAAYWINRRAMEIVYKAPWTKDRWAEDQFCGKTLGAFGIEPEHDERFQVCHCDICMKKFDLAKRLTQHTPEPKMMYDLWNSNSTVTAR